MEMAGRLKRLERRLERLERQESATVRYQEAATSSPPTDAQLDAAFGDPADLHNGFIGILKNTSLGTSYWLVWVVDGVWAYEEGTKAV